MKSLNIIAGVFVRQRGAFCHAPSTTTGPKAAPANPRRLQLKSTGPLRPASARDSCRTERAEIRARVGPPRSTTFQILVELLMYVVGQYLALGRLIKLQAISKGHTTYLVQRHAVRYGQLLSAPSDDPLLYFCLLR